MDQGTSPETSGRWNPRNKGQPNPHPHRRRLFFLFVFAQRRYVFPPFSHVLFPFLFADLKWDLVVFLVIHGLDLDAMFDLLAFLLRSTFCFPFSSLYLLNFR